MDDIDFSNKRIVIRTDYNVPLDSEGKITSTTRIDYSLDTLLYIISQNPSSIIIISHLGRPSGVDPSLSLKPVQKYLEGVLHSPVSLKTLDEYTTPSTSSPTITLLENIRFYREETENLQSTSSFRQKLNSLCDVYVNDAFGCCHRAHSSIVGINPPQKCPGLLVTRELKYLQNIFTNRDKSSVYTLILGGSKINDKIRLITNLIPKVDNILIGGGMAFTFLKYLGYPIGKSLFDKEGYEMIPDIIAKAKQHSTRLVYPVDFICNKYFANTGDVLYKDLEDGVPQDYMGLDIGENTIGNFVDVLQESDYIIWNGPLGVFEFDNFSRGSRKIMEFLGETPAVTIIGGGDTSSCCQQFKMTDRVSHLSTGGGASLELLEGKTLPGISHLRL